MDSVHRTALLFGISLFLTCAFSADDKGNCNACHCADSAGNVFNLEPLAFTNGTPRFVAKYTVHENDTDPVLVSYNPCKPFSQDDPCKDAAACFRDNGEVGGKYYVKFGTQESSKWTLGKDNAISYEHNGNTFKVNLQCNGTVNGSFEVIDVTKTMIETTLTSKCCCPDGCPMTVNPPSKTKSKLSTGSILLIIFFSLVIVYLLGGVIYNKVMNGATGKELIPNWEFWSALPRLVLDGVAFTCNCCSKRKSSPGYDNM